MNSASLTKLWVVAMLGSAFSLNLWGFSYFPLTDWKADGPVSGEVTAWVGMFTFMVVFSTIASWHSLRSEDYASWGVIIAGQALWLVAPLTFYSELVASVPLFFIPFGVVLGNVAAAFIVPLAMKLRG